MSVTFLNPKGLRNLQLVSICFEFSNNDPVNLKTLKSGSCSLAATSLYLSDSCTGCSPTTYGLYFPKVTSQTELNSNFAKLGNSTWTRYCFFKQNAEAEWVLHETSDLSTGYAEGAPVEAFREERKVGVVLESELSTTVITARIGGNIIIGVLDTLGEEEY